MKTISKRSRNEPRLRTEREKRIYLKRKGRLSASSDELQDFAARVGATRGVELSRAQERSLMNGGSIAPIIREWMGETRRALRWART